MCRDPLGLLTEKLPSSFFWEVEYPATGGSGIIDHFDVDGSALRKANGGVEANLSISHVPAIGHVMTPGSLYPAIHRAAVSSGRLCTRLIALLREQHSNGEIGK